MISDDIAKALNCIDQGNNRGAEILLRKVIKKDPANERAYILLAMVVYAIDERISYLLKAVEINPKNASAQAYLRSLEEEKRGKQKRETHQNGEENKVAKKNIQRGKSEPLPAKSKRETITTNARLKRKRKPTKRNDNEPQEGNVEENKKEDGKGKKGDEENVEDKQSHGVNKKPEYVYRSHEDDFFYGFREGIDQSSREVTGMFGRSIIVDGLHISAYDGPPCIALETLNNDTNCEFCEFYSPTNCLLRFDEFLLEDINRFREMRAEWHKKLARKRRIILKVVYRELKAHGRPLHYTMIAKIILGRYLKYKLNTQMIYQCIIEHPGLFERVDAGIYRAK